MRKKSLKQSSELTFTREHVVGEVVAGELVPGEGEVREVLPGAILGRDLTREEVAAEVKVADEGHGSDGERNF